MKIQNHTIRLIMIIGGLLYSSFPALAVDFDFQPRFETGMVSYTFEQSAGSRSVPTGINDTAGFNKTQQEIEFSATMGFIGGGATVFINRLFVDLSGQYTAQGDDHLDVTRSIYKETDETHSNLSSFTTLAAGYDVELDRTDHAVSIGYAVTKRLSVFAGYKWAVIDLFSTFDGHFSDVTIDSVVLNGKIIGYEDAEFKYDGPFIGIAHGWPIDGSSILQGVMSVNAGLAQLNSRLTQSRITTQQVESMNGQDVDPVDMPPQTLTEYESIKGDTLGLTLGVSWRGLTPLENLSYSLGISGYRYQFDSNDPRSMDLSETSVTFKIGAAYVF